MQRRILEGLSVLLILTAFIIAIPMAAAGATFREEIARGRQHAEAGRHRDAAAAYEAALKLAATDAERIAARQALAVTALRMGDRQAAMDHCRHISELAPGNLWARVFLSSQFGAGDSPEPEKPAPTRGLDDDEQKRGLDYTPKPAGHAPGRLALVIGNADYALGALANPIHDAELMRDVLIGLGFEVDFRENLTQAQMLEAINTFGRRLSGMNVGLFYYSGHGVQIRGENYLIPVGEDIRSEAEVESEAVGANRVIGNMTGSGVGIKLVILDACRNNPFLRSFRNASAGLAPMQAGEGFIIAYSTQPGNVAYDGQGANSPYTAALARHIQTPCLRIEDVFMNVRRDVITETREISRSLPQIPWEATSTVTSVKLSGCEPGEPPSEPPPVEPKIKTLPGENAGHAELAVAKDDLSRELDTARGERRQVDVRAEEISRAEQAFRQEIEKWEVFLSRQRPQLKEFDDKLKELDARRKEIEKLFAGDADRPGDDEPAGYRVRTRELGEQMTGVRAEREAKAQELRSAEEELKRLIASLPEQTRSWKQERERLRDRGQELDDGIAELERDLETVSGRLARFGALTVAVEPPDAALTLEGVDGPCCRDLPLPAGDYRVTASRAGYRAITERISVPPGQSVSRTIRLTQEPGRLTVIANPSDAEISFPDLPREYRPDMEIPPGRHTVRVACSGYRPEETEVTIVSGQPTRVQVALEADAGTLNVYVDPPGARVTFADTGRAYSCGMEVETGRHRLRIAHPCCDPVTRSVEVRSGRVTTEHVTLTPAAVITNDLGMRFTKIPPGTFPMGSPPGEIGRLADRERQHLVEITRGYYLQATEVTQGQWSRVMGENPSVFRGCGEDCPVDSVSWNRVQDFIRRLNDREPGFRYRLPTEAEWEYACRAGAHTAFTNGDIRATGCRQDPGLDQVAWYCANAGGRPHSVASKAPNRWGLYDMHGNVWEWCQDWYAPYRSTSLTDPMGPAGGAHRMGRGGSWSFGAEFARSARRTTAPPSYEARDLGFRLVVESLPTSSFGGNACR